MGVSGTAAATMARTAGITAARVAASVPAIEYDTHDSMAEAASGANTAAAG